MMKRLLLFVVLFMFCPVAAASRDRGDFIPASVAHYKFEDNTDSNTVLDSSGNDYHGTSIRNTSLMHVAGQIGGALEFDGAADYVDTGQAFKSTFQKDFSISVWLEAADGHPATSKNIWGTAIGGVGKNRCNLTLLSNGRLQFYYIANVILSGSSLESPVLLADGQETWHHVVCVVKQSSDVNTTLYIYFDGVLKAEKDISNIMSGYVNDYNLSLGNTNSAGVPEAGFYLDGSLDDFMIFNKALTADEIEALYESVKGVRRDR